MLTDTIHNDEFVGRRDELAFLQKEFAAACEGSVRFCLVEGEAGIGKSRLIQEFRASLGSQALVAVGYCSEHVRAPYLPIKEILQHVDHSAARARGHVREAAVSYGDERSAFFHTVGEAVRRAGARKPLVIIIEDVQWADSATLELLRYLLVHLGTARALFLVTLRTEGVVRNAGLAAQRSAASRNRFGLVHLQAHRRNEIRHLVQQMLLRRSLRLDPATVSQIEVLAEGSPLFAEELARIAVETGGEVALQRNMPLSLQAILSERLAPFSDDERQMLVRAAILGQTFDVPLLAAIARREADDVLAVMQRAVERELLAETSGTLQQFRFHHELIRQALADQLVLSVAEPLHVRVAEELEMREDARDRAAELAYHWSSARVADKARLWNEAAAEAAWAVYAYRDAIRFYSAALRWKYPAGRDRAAIYERLGTLLYIDGCGEEPATWFARCREEYEACGDAVGASRALLLLADQSWVDAKTDESLRAASEAATRLDRLGNTSLYGDAILTIARFSITLGNIAQARSHLRAVSRLASHFDARTMAMLHEVGGETYAAAGNTKAALADMHAAARLASESGVSELIAQVENNFALAALDLGEIDLALAHHRIALDEAHRTDMMWRIAYCSLTYARTLTLKGDLPEARRLVWQALESGATTATFKTKAAAVGIPLALLVNDAALLEACADETVPAYAERSREAQRIASVAAAFAEFYVAQDRAEDARELLGKALRAIVHTHRCWDFFLAVAKWGHPHDVALARTMLSAAPGRPRIQRAYAILFSAIINQGKNPALSQRMARAAARAFRGMGDTLHAQHANELAGGKPLKKEAAPNRPRELTARQSEIARLIAQGETNKAIAQQLQISEHTVEHHVSDIFERLNVKSRTQLATLVTHMAMEI